MNKYADASLQQIEIAVQSSWQAFLQYRKKNLKERANFLRTIASGLQNNSLAIIETAMQETNLEEARLKTEFRRTIFQLTSYAQACEEGTWLDIRINTTGNQPQASKVDLRKMLIPLGPVVVFGASNFPFAYSTAGGDTACALAVGCPVIIKVHPAHAGTSELVFEVIKKAANECKLPEGVFHHLHGASFEVGKALVQNPLVKAVSFTGSFEGGKALFDLVNQREEPIPIFAEMGSVNPVFLLPEKLKNETAALASMYANSITQSVGQFCTNPGILVGIGNEWLDKFERLLAHQIDEVKPAKMLTKGIGERFHTSRKTRYAEGAEIITRNDVTVEEDESLPTLARVSAKVFLETPLLHKEVFGPFSILVKCVDIKELLEVAKDMEGQLTTTLIATEDEIKNNLELVDILKEKCGRFILNGVPTGVEVALAMHHGGPYPATTDSRFTAVGADGIKRFARPICYQNWSNDLLPDELKNENPLKLWRTVNGQLVSISNKPEAL